MSGQQLATLHEAGKTTEERVLLLRKKTLFPPDLSWADETFDSQGDNLLIKAPGAGLRIVMYFYRKGNMGDGEVNVGFKWEGSNKIFFDSRLWYCGIELALLPPRRGPENKGLFVHLKASEPQSRRVNMSVAYKVEMVKKQ